MFRYKNFIKDNYQFIVYFKHEVGLCGKEIKIKNYGFIGGASGKISDNTVVFFGNAEMHPYYSSIRELCSKNKIEIKILCKTKMFCPICEEEHEVDLIEKEKRDNN